MWAHIGSIACPIKNIKRKISNMYAIVEITGKQYKVEKDATINVDRIKDLQAGELKIDKVLLYSGDGTVQIGQPYLKNVTVKAEVLGEFKGRKVRGIKFKRRKNYTRTMGHRHAYTKIKIKDLVAG
jgi:large subunit ribosomal protein L21